MTFPVLPVTDEARITLLRTEDRLRALHALRHEARLQPGFEAPYVGFVRTLRERLHPRGVRNVRTLTLPDGMTFQVDLGDRVGCDAFYGCFDERFEADLFEEALQPGAVMFDVGASFGYFAVRCGRAFGPTGAVHAFEPDPATRALLTANAAANGLSDRLHIHAFAVADADREAEVHPADEAALGGPVSAGRSGTREVVTVTARGLDSFAAEHRIERVDALKIDVVGQESAVLRGASDLLRRSPDPLVMLDVRTRHLAEDVRADLRAALVPLYVGGYLGFVPDLTVEGGLREIETAEEAADLLSANLLLMRPRGAVATRVRASLARRLSLDDHTEPRDGSLTVDDDPRAIRLVAGLDPDLVSAALRDKADAESRAEIVSNELHELYDEIAKLRTERKTLRAEVRLLSVTPFSLAVRGTHRLLRALSPRARPAP